LVLACFKYWQCTKRSWHLYSVDKAAIYICMDKIEYLMILDRIMPRVLGLIDRDSDSETYGCCDRNFWMYKLTDFSSGIIQQCSLTLSLLYSNSNYFGNDCLYIKDEHSDYYKNIAMAVNRWTLKIVNSGALDEYYPKERSFPATAFTAYALLKSSLILNDQYILQSDKLSDIANFLCDRKPSPAANQDVAAAAYLWLYYDNINKSDKYLEQIRSLLNREDFGGNFNEYMGFDFGYSTVTVNYLSYMVDDGYSNAERYIRKLSDIICCTASASPIVSGNIFSRNTSYYLPYAIETIINLYPEKSKKLKNLSFLSIMSILDDRYMMHYFTPSLAYSAFSKKSIYVNNKDSNYVENVNLLNYGGVVCITYKHTTLVISLIKAGLFSISHGGNHYCNNGYRLTNKNKTYSSGNIVGDLGKDSIISQDNNNITITMFGVFSKYKNLSPSPVKMVVLRSMSMFGPYLNLLFKRILITKPNVLNGSSITRKVVINLKQGSIIVKDMFNIPKKSVIYLSPNYSSRLVPSAKFYQESDLPDNWIKLDENSSYIMTNISLMDNSINTTYESNENAVNKRIS